MDIGLLIFALIFLVIILGFMLVFYRYGQNEIARLRVRVHSYEDDIDTIVSDKLETYKKSFDREVIDREVQGQIAAFRNREEPLIRSDAIKRSGHVLKGKALEQFAPLLGMFPYNPKDVRFLGSPIDLIVFDGLSEGELRNIVFIEVKSGKRVSLTDKERGIQFAIESGQIKHEVFHIQI